MTWDFIEIFLFVAVLLIHALKHFAGLIEQAKRELEE